MCQTMPTSRKFPAPNLVIPTAITGAEKLFRGAATPRLLYSRMHGAPTTAPTLPAQSPTTRDMTGKPHRLSLDHFSCGKTGTTSPSRGEISFLEMPRMSLSGGVLSYPIQGHHGPFRNGNRWMQALENRVRQAQSNPFARTTLLADWHRPH